MHRFFVAVLGLLAGCGAVDTTLDWPFPLFPQALEPRAGAPAAHVDVRVRRELELRRTYCLGSEERTMVGRRTRIECRRDGRISALAVFEQDGRYMFGARRVGARRFEREGVHTTGFRSYVGTEVAGQRAGVWEYFDVAGRTVQLEYYDRGTLVSRAGMGDEPFEHCLAATPGAAVTPEAVELDDAAYGGSCQLVRQRARALLEADRTAYRDGPMCNWRVLGCGIPLVGEVAGRKEPFVGDCRGDGDFCGPSAQPLTVDDGTGGDRPVAQYVPRLRPRPHAPARAASRAPYRVERDRALARALESPEESKPKPRIVYEGAFGGAVDEQLDLRSAARLALGLRFGRTSYLLNLQTATGFMTFELHRSLGDRFWVSAGLGGFDFRGPSASAAVGMAFFPLPVGYHGSLFLSLRTYAGYSFDDEEPVGNLVFEYGYRF